ncbi:WD40-repeat-containing domain protein [Amylostereum chailletii]|nr:WD40-repeat-containing domain protein [Amylostereum chailletii]
MDHVSSLASTQTVIQNFVSSHETDRYICHGSRSFLTPPYSCAYSNAAKNGGVAHLAVATEQGSVYIWDTTSQNGRGEHRPQRIDLNIHNNGIFDVSWSASDDLLATASGDNTVRITDPITGKILYNLDGHTTTVKAVVWNPSNPSLLSTGGRDGCICLWDLRSSERHLRRDDDIDFMGPETLIKGAHDDASQTPARGRGKKTKLGSGLTSGLLFGLGIDSRIHTYATPTLNPLPADTNCFTHPDMMTNSFYSRLSVSPDGRWLASGSTKTTVGGSAFAFDVAHAGRVNPGPVSTQGVRLTAHSGEVCAVDWANDSLATCADDGSVRIWRNDPEVRWRCEADCNQASDWAWGVVNGP